MSYVFLSYCHDNRRQAALLRRRLLDAGIEVWWDQDIEPGRNIQNAISEALLAAEKVVVCFSTETAKRTQTGIFPELRDAISLLRKMPPEASFLILVRFSDCPIPDLKIDAEHSLNVLRYVDLFPKSRREAGIRELLRALKSTTDRLKIAKVQVVLNWGVRFRTESEINVYLSKDRNKGIALATAKKLAEALRNGGWDEEKVEQGLLEILQGCFETHPASVGFDLSYSSGVYFDRPYCEIGIGFDRSLQSVEKRDKRIAQLWVEVYHDHLRLDFGDDDGTGLDYSTQSIVELAIDFYRIFLGARRVAEGFGLMLPEHMDKPFVSSDEDGGEFVFIPAASSRPTKSGARPAVRRIGLRHAAERQSH